MGEEHDITDSRIFECTTWSCQIRPVVLRNREYLLRSSLIFTAIFAVFNSHCGKYSL